LHQEPGGDIVNADDIDDLNAFLFLRNHERALGEVLEDFRAAQERVLAILGQMSTADLAKPYAHYQPGDADASQQPVIDWIAGNTYDHDEEHLATMQALAGR
jgi:hypothetical protein